MIRRPRLAALVAVTLVGIAVGCGGSADVADDPLALARFYGEAAATCDIEHARIAIAFGAGWTTDVAAAQREQERRARVQLARCRRDVEPGSRVEARLERSTATDAVVAVSTVGPSGRGALVRMEFRKHGSLGGDDPRWWRVR